VRKSYALIIAVNRVVVHGMCLLVTWRVVSSPPRRRVADTSVCGCSVQPSRSVAPPLVFSTGPCTRVEQNCSGTILDVTKSRSGYHTGLTKIFRFRTGCHNSVHVFQTGWSIKIVHDFKLSSFH
jgi:hypothetical protein